MPTLNWQNRMAAAVALEAERVAAGFCPADAEGAAYKAEWDRRGGNALSLCRESRDDAARMGALAIHGELRMYGWHSGAPAFAEFEAQELVRCRECVHDRGPAVAAALHCPRFGQARPITPIRCRAFKARTQ